VPRYAAVCRSLPVVRRKLLIFFGLVFSSCQRGGRRFEPGLVLQIK